MPRIKIQLPGQFHFSCTIPVRITDINYGGHVGNDAFLSLIHEARMQYLHHLGFTEMQFGGTGMIMADMTIEFKAELFYGESVIISVAPADISKAGFDLIYLLEKENAGVKSTVAIAKTGMICFDYTKKKVVSIPEMALQKLK